MEAIPRNVHEDSSEGCFSRVEHLQFRVWSAGALVSNIGTWMQRVAQDWLVLTQLTHHDASAVGIVMALQFAPQLFCCLGPDLLQIISTNASLALAWESLRSRATSVFGRSMYLRFCLARRLHWMLQCARPLLRSWWVLKLEQQGIERALV
jgi:hypothetical protein